MTRPAGTGRSARDKPGRRLGGHKHTLTLACDDFAAFSLYTCACNPGPITLIS
jgi:hypothetical protein